MYYPYFRGKQYELVTIREMAPVLRKAEFCPVVEPVRESLSGLRKALNAIESEDGRAIVVVNPYYGDLSRAGESLTQLLQDEFLDIPGISAGILLKQEASHEAALELFEAHTDHSPVFIHAGFAEAKALAARLGALSNDQSHIFYDQDCGKLYQKHFKGARRILLKDGFQRKRNRDYGFVEHFSDLHATFIDEGMDGFGDFLIVGSDFSESGGPAYAVAIHLTFIDPDQDDAMMIYHFVSDRQDTPKDPAGKFGEALFKMIEKLDSGNSNVLETAAVLEFRDLHKRGHFPGLGYIKKLSMNHHIETMAEYFQSQ